MADQQPNYFEQGAAQVHPSRDVRADMASLSYMRRMAQPDYSPRSRFAGRAGGAGQDPMLGAMVARDAGMPDYSSFTYDPGLNAQARAAGVVPLSPDQVQRNAVLPNSGFFGNHPNLSRMLEGGLFGAAATHGSDTWGEGISNVAGGLIEGRQARAGLLNQQFARPFQAAGMLESLRDMGAKRDLQESQIQEQRSLADLHRAQINEVNKGEHHITPITAADRGVYNYDSKSGTGAYTPFDDYDPKRAARASGSETEFDRQIDLANQERATKGLPPMDSQARMAYHNQWQSGAAGPAAGAKLPYEVYQERNRWIDSKDAEGVARREFLTTPGADMKNWGSFLNEWKTGQRGQLNQEFPNQGRAVTGNQPLPQGNPLPSGGVKPAKPSGSMEDRLKGLQKKVGIGGPQAANTPVDNDPYGWFHAQNIMGNILGSLGSPTFQSTPYEPPK